MELLSYRKLSLRAERFEEEDEELGWNGGMGRRWESSLGEWDSVGGGEERRVSLDGSADLRKWKVYGDRRRDLNGRDNQVNNKNKKKRSIGGGSTGTVATNGMAEGVSKLIKRVNSSVKKPSVRKDMDDFQEESIIIRKPTLAEKFKKGHSFASLKIESSTTTTSTTAAAAGGLKSKLKERDVYKSLSLDSSRPPLPKNSIFSEVGNSNGIGDVKEGGNREKERDESQRLQYGCVPIPKKNNTNNTNNTGLHPQMSFRGSVLRVSLQADDYIRFMMRRNSQFVVKNKKNKKRKKSKKMFRKIVKVFVKTFGK